MKRIFMISIFIIFTGSFSFAIPSEVTVAENNVPLQAESTSPRVITLVQNGMKLTTLGDDGKFFKVRYINRDLWIAKDFTLEADPLDYLTDEELTDVNTIPVINFSTKEEKFAIMKKAIKRYAKIYGLPEYVVLGCIRIESNFNLNTVSKSGCLGLMQLHPGYASNWGYDNGRLCEMIYNINFGCKELSTYFKSRGDISKALSVYNTGSLCDKGLKYAKLVIDSANSFERENFLYTDAVSNIY